MIAIDVACATEICFIDCHCTHIRSCDFGSLLRECVHVHCALTCCVLVLVSNRASHTSSSSRWVCAHWRAATACCTGAWATGTSGAVTITRRWCNETNRNSILNESTISFCLLHTHARNIAWLAAKELEFHSTFDHCRTRREDRARARALCVPRERQR
jgi:hypothetical protein